jgi:CheY-like chemotaxis protein
LGSEIAQALGDARLTKKHILIVEDDPATIKRISSSLVGGGYGIVEAPTIEDARAALANQDIQAVIFDRLLGDADTVEEIRDWRRRGINLPVLVLSSLSGLTDRIWVLRRVPMTIWSNLFTPRSSTPELPLWYARGIAMRPP